MGFAMFPVRKGPFPMAQHPSELFPRLQQYRVTAARTFSPFHGVPVSAAIMSPCLWYVPKSCSRPQGFAPHSSPLPYQVLPPGHRSMLPWALPLVGTTVPPVPRSEEAVVEPLTSSFRREAGPGFDQDGTREDSGYWADRNRPSTPPSDTAAARGDGHDVGSSRAPRIRRAGVPISSLRRLVDRDRLEHLSPRGRPQSDLPSGSSE
jgi:hypothetical protein